MVGYVACRMSALHSNQTAYDRHIMKLCVYSPTTARCFVCKQLCLKCCHLTDDGQCTVNTQNIFCSHRWILLSGIGESVPHVNHRCVQEGPICGGRSYLWRKVLFVVESPICGARSYLWRKVLFVEEGPICSGRSYLWMKVLSVEEGPICGGRSYLWRKVLFVEESYLWRKVLFVEGGQAICGRGSYFWGRY